MPLSERRTPHQSASDTHTTPDERKHREERILDAATVLLVRWGYRKTTIDDIAREAGVGKGTIYLHWKDKTDLFHAAFVRATKHVSDDAQQRINADSEGGLFHRMWMHSMVAALSDPIIAAMMQGKTDLFQGFMETIDARFYEQILGQSDVYFLQMQQAGLIRKDIPVNVLTFLVSALKLGIAQSSELLGPQHVPPIAQLAEGMSDLIRRWLEPEVLPSDSIVGKQLTNALIDTTNEML